ncbi:TetR/AcrR family transcriptional regulator [Leptospira interrogans]|uniref:Transcriptional regulator n=16 Tax=Leptospira interrogans TaxID=173 RepID=Q8F6M1_LEPIN|nr:MULTISPECIES: TetR/AcrR family transcriptional regulator [Leptospira]EMF42388.1 transcriptional regulator, TetR family [Leptospira interrogans serovar Lora str. TE 1992]EMF71655.1 transcriptional regulator, TetR family [Leptospira interrogans serovar Canicola str. LT1962]EMG12273.1 transcriptional regulator, TetR family [Leptospira interrogans serovar Grippotyphosa str. LT2186]EMM82042.1 transcriptional regulator, TetR family [Leptospira interrogans str. 2006001854]EMM97266.1 transcriptiona
MDSPNQEMHESIELDSKWPEGQKKIFLAAIEIFAQKGFSAATTIEISKKAGVAEGLIFKHFKSKKELLLRLVSPILEKFFAPLTLRRLQTMVFSQKFTSLEQFLTAIFEERIGFVRSNKNLMRIILQEAFVTLEVRSLLERVFRQRVVPLVQEHLKKFQDAGMISKEISISSAFRLVAVNLAGFVLLTEIFYPPKPEDGWDQETELKRTIEFIARGLAPKIQEVPAPVLKPKKKPTVRKTATKVKKKKKRS